VRRVITKTKRLKLVTTKEKDIDILYRKLYSQKNVMQYTYGRVLNFDETKALVQKKFTFDKLLGFAPIIKKSSNEIVGVGGILQFSHNCYEFGYIFQQDSWGLGYATEIALGQIETIKQNFPNVTIVATVHPKNLASQKVLTKIGMQFKEQIELKGRGLRDIWGYNLTK